MLDVLRTYRIILTLPEQTMVFPRLCSFLTSSLLLQLLGQLRVLHSCCQHSEEERWKEGAEVEGHPGDGVGQQDLLPLPVHCLHDLIGQEWRAHATGQLACEICGWKTALDMSRHGLMTPRSLLYSHSSRTLDFGEGSTAGEDSEALMKV